MNVLVTGGFEPNFTVGFAKGLAANGIELCVVSCDETAQRLTAAGIDNVNLRGSLDPKRAGWRKFINLWVYYGRLLWFLCRHRGATVHFTGIFRREFILWEGIVLNWSFRLLARRYLYTVHNVLPHNCERTRFFRWIYARIYRVPDVLLVHTQRGRQQLIDEFGVAAERIQLTSLGLNEEMPVTGMSRADARKRLGIGEGEKVILFFGKIDEYKGLDVLLEAFEKLNVPAARLLVAGTFRSADYRMRIISQLEEMPRRQEVRLDERFIPNEEAEVFFQAADVLCLPYRNIYQSGLVFLGPRFGIPMVTTDVGSLREFVSDGLGLVTGTNDARGLAEALGEFFGNPDRYSRTAILDRAQKYRWPTVCRNLVPLYQARSGVPAASGSAKQDSGFPAVPGRDTVAKP